MEFPRSLLPRNIFDFVGVIRQLLYNHVRSLVLLLQFHGAAGPVDTGSLSTKTRSPGTKVGARRLLML